MTVPSYHAYQKETMYHQCAKTTNNNLQKRRLNKWHASSLSLQHRWLTWRKHKLQERKDESHGGQVRRKRKMGWKEEEERI
jgi:hypothetical protein